MNTLLSFRFSSVFEAKQARHAFFQNQTLLCESELFGNTPEPFPEIVETFPDVEIRAQVVVVLFCCVG